MRLVQVGQRSLSVQVSLRRGIFSLKHPTTRAGIAPQPSHLVTFMTSSHQLDTSPKVILMPCANSSVPPEEYHE